MPKYRYDLLQVSAFEPRKFAPNDLRGAVEHLKTLDQTGHVGILVEVDVKAGQFRLRAPAFLKLEQIVGKKPAEVWAILDAEIDRQIAYFERRDGRYSP